MIVHGFNGSGTAIGIQILSGADNGVVIENCVVYDLSGTIGYGFLLGGEGMTVRNCVAHGCRSNGFLESGTTTTPAARNCAGLANLGNDFSGSFDASSSNNASSDTTAPGTAAKKSLTDSAQFVDVTGGSEDFHLRVGADLIGAGADLSGSFTDDLDGHDRIVPWDIGADGVPLAATMRATHRFVGSGVHRRVG